MQSYNSFERVNAQKSGGKLERSAEGAGAHFKLFNLSPKLIPIQFEKLSILIQSVRAIAKGTKSTHLDIILEKTIAAVFVSQKSIPTEGF